MYIGMGLGSFNGILILDRVVLSICRWILNMIELFILKLFKYKKCLGFYNGFRRRFL